MFDCNQSGCTYSKLLEYEYWFKKPKKCFKKIYFLIGTIILRTIFCCFITRINRFSRRISRYFKFRFNESLFLYWNMYNCCSLWISSVEKNKKWWFLPDDSDIDEYISEFTLPFKMILLIIVSFIFLVTDLENVLPHWGMTLFGNTIGQWIYNVFFSLAISYMVDVVVSIVQYVIVKTFKLPFKMIRSKH